MRASLNAGVTAGRALKVYAVEKNPNAVITLRNRAIMDGWDNVTIVAKDMRQWVRRAALSFAQNKRGLFVCSWTVKKGAPVFDFVGKPVALLMGLLCGVVLPEVEYVGRS